MKAYELLKNPKKAQEIRKNETNGIEIPENIDVYEQIFDILDQHLEQRNSVKWKSSGKQSPSSGNMCARYIGYKYRGYESEFTASGRTYRILDLGNEVENLAIGYFQELGIVKATQLYLSKDNPPMHGFLDILLEVNGIEIPVENKSINEAGFMYRKNFNKPKDDHYHQIQMYLHLGGWDEGMVLYWNKNDSDVLPLLVKKDEAYITKVLDKYGKIYGETLKGNLSIRPYKSINSKTCQYCDAKNYCWNKDTTVGIKIK